jgi:uncharacterized protein (TIGR02246 family)
MTQHAEVAFAGDVEAITRLVASAVTHQSDVAALMDLHTNDTIVVNFAGRRVLGRSTFRDAMRQALETPLANVFTTVQVDDVRFLRPDVAIASCTKTIRDERDEAARSGAGSLPEVGTMSYVVVRDSDGWRIALAQTTPILR